MTLKQLGLLYFTVRHLKPVQWYWRLYLRLQRLWRFNTALPATVASKPLPLLPPAPKPVSWRENTFVFLNQPGSAAAPIDWNNPKQAKLWLYNLHYFDYLQQPGLTRDQALLLMHDWITQNPPATGNGWEPYPLSLRIVNWIKFLSAHDDAEDLTTLKNSLYLQCRYLSGHLEYHLLGNHLFKNGVALLFGGAYFTGAEATAWLKTGRTLLEAEIQEQVLPDGGHFERSPMYHALILEDILDCLNLHQAQACFPAASAAQIAAQACQMLVFAQDTQHPDGEIAFFNDSALGIAPSPGALRAYATRLALPPTALASNPETTLRLIEKPDFGLYVLQNTLGQLIFDAGPIGPDYLPGHAHCDTLSYELSLWGQRCIVNRGTYQYAGPERNLFRATAAHNTVKLDGAEQHEIWSTFRVARRGYPDDIKIERQPDKLTVSAAHTGYRRLPGHLLHRRTIVCSMQSWHIEDRIEGHGRHSAESFIHLHPAVRIVDNTPTALTCVIGNRRFVIRVSAGATLTLVDGVFSPEFGLKQANHTLILRAEDTCPFMIAYDITPV